MGKKWSFPYTRELGSSVSATYYDSNWRHSGKGKTIVTIKDQGLGGGRGEQVEHRGFLGQ